jgi:nicotinamide-nucleotide amidase
MELLGGVAYCLPGVPHEMKPMLEASVLPDLQKRQPEPAVVVARIIRTAGMWESAVAEAMGPEIERLHGIGGNPEIAFLASGGMTRVKITARAQTPEQAQEIIAPTEEFALQVLGDAVFGFDEDTIERQVHDLLLARGETVVTAESLTGGLLAARLSELPGSSAILRGGIVAYSSELKQELLGVDGMTLRLAGSVTADVATAMASGARERLGATYALALTGVAGPEPWDGKPVGTVFIALAHPGGCEVRETRLPGDRERIRDYSCVSALDLLRRHLLAADSAKTPRPS